MNSCREHLAELLSHWDDHHESKGEIDMILIEKVDWKEAFYSTRKCHIPRCRASVLFKVSWDKKEIRSRIRR